MCGVGGAVGGFEGEGEGRDIDNDGGCCALSAVMCVPRLPEIHGETYGPNIREIVVGAFVAWCPHKYL